MRRLAFEYIHSLQREFDRMLRQHVDIVRHADFVEFFQPHSRPCQIPQAQARQADF